MTKSKTLNVSLGRGERGYRGGVGLESKIDEAKSGFYAVNPGIKVVSESMAVTQEGNVLLSISYETAEKK